MKITRLTSYVLPLLLCTALAAQVNAQTPDKDNPVLKGTQVTESNLIDALAIAPPDAASGATRGFKVSRPGAPAHKAGPGKASLLITFATNSTELSEDTMHLLDTLGHALQSDTLAGFSFKVEGHADARGEADANQLLSQERAQAVVDYLTAHEGILPERLSAVGKGSSEPMNKEHVDAPENRRVTIVTTRN